ncbi:MAG: methyltransferase domain-containing protein [Rhodocyclaceae bacterium]|nr:methyltransferase domain-containing protein [Rhodocyclaceae bacterium]
MSAPDRLADARVLWHMLRGQPAGGGHAQRLTAFYAPQAEHYDAFRARLLQGRRELIQKLAPPPRAHIVELGCGTGANLVHFGDGLAGLGRVDLVDLCPPLLEQARRRAARLGNVRVIEADACRYDPGQPVDCVYFSYSLTMIPDWRGALTNAIGMLRPGGRLGIVDFHLPADGGLANHFWRRWFAHDGVHLSAEHLPHLQRLLPAHVVQQRRAAVPYLPGLRVPYYLLLAWKP